jgi:hypothetical protein
MKMKNCISCFYLIAILIAGCKKYEENPLINLKNKETRLQGTYYLGGYTINGADAMDSLKSTTPLSKFVFFIDHRTYPSKDPVIGFQYFNGSCEWADHKKSLILYLTKTCFINGPLSESGKKWTITKLTDHQLHLKINYQDQEYAVAFYKQ